MVRGTARSACANIAPCDTRKNPHLTPALSAPKGGEGDFAGAAYVPLRPLGGGDRGRSARRLRYSFLRASLRLSGTARPAESHLSHRIPLVPPNPACPAASHLSHRIPLVPPHPACPTESRLSHRIPLVQANPTCPGESHLSQLIPANLASDTRSHPASRSGAGRALRRRGRGATVRPAGAALRAERPPERRNGRSPSATVEAPWRCGSARSSRNQPHTPQVEEEARAPRGPRRATCGMEEATGGRAGRRRFGH